MRNCTDCGVNEFRRHLALAECIHSSLIAVAAAPIDAAILLAIAANKRFHSTFYAVLLNMAFCDFLIATVLCPLRAYLAHNSFQLQRLNEPDACAFKFVAIILSTTATLNVALLSADRLLSLKAPSTYRSLASHKVLAILLSIWLPGFMLSPLCLYVNFKVLLSSTSIVTGAIGSVLSVITYATYKSNLRTALDRAVGTVVEDDSSPIVRDLDEPNRKCLASSLIFSAKQNLNKLDIKKTKLKALSKQDPDYQFYQIEKRATTTFFWMMVVFLAFYVPIIGLSVYVIACSGGRDITAVALSLHLIMSLTTSSALVRSALFMVRITALRKVVADFFVSRQEADKRWRSESLASNYKLCGEDRKHSRGGRARAESAIQAV